jgi:hypothetical protein
MRRESEAEQLGVDLGVTCQCDAKEGASANEAAAEGNVTIVFSPVTLFFVE